jgi:hypothetical protein
MFGNDAFPSGLWLMADIESVFHLQHYSLAIFEWNFEPTDCAKCFDSLRCCRFLSGAYPV